MVTAVVFDVGETLLDETRLWQQVAKDAGVPAFTLMGTIGGLITRGEHHQRVWEVLGTDPVPGDFSSADFYPDALPCLRRLDDAGFLVGAVGNTPASAEELLRPHTSFVGSSARWGVEKPSSGFFERLIAECARPSAEIAYVGDRVDNDVAPAIAAGIIWSAHSARAVGPSSGNADWCDLNPQPQRASYVAQESGAMTALNAGPARGICAASLAPSAPAALAHTASVDPAHRLKRDH